MMLFTASVTVRRDSSLALDDAFYRSVPGYVGEVHRAVAANVAEGATPSYRLVSDDSLRFAMTEWAVALRSAGVGFRECLYGDDWGSDGGDGESCGGGPRRRE